MCTCVVMVPLTIVKIYLKNIFMLLLLLVAIVRAVATAMLLLVLLHYDRS